MNGTRHFKTACHRCALLMALLVLVSGCHKPSTRLEPQINFLEELNLKLPLPDDAIPELMKDQVVNRGSDLAVLLDKNSREYAVFKSALGSYMSYYIQVDVDRELMPIEERNPISPEKLKEDKKSNHDKELARYQAAKDALNQAVEMLRRMEASE